MRGTNMTLKVFGIWPHFFQHGPKWKSRGQVPNPFVTSLALSKMNGPKWFQKDLGPESVFPTWTTMKKQGSGSKPFCGQACPFQNGKGPKWLQMGLEPDPIFRTWTKVEKQGSGSKQLRDQFGTFQNERVQNYFKRGWSPTPFFQHGPKWKSRSQVPSPFGTNLVPFKMKGRLSKWKEPK